MAVFKLKLSFKILLVIALFGVLSFYFIFDPSEFLFFPKCPFHSLTGFYCPGCGSQRAAHAILNGHILEGLRHNFLIVLLTFVLGYQLILYLITRFSKRNVKNILHNSKTTYTILVLVILFWILRNIHLYPFTYLAP